MSTQELKVKRPKLRVGLRYRDGFGRIVQIICITSHRRDWFVGDNGNWYTSDGKLLAWHKNVGGHSSNTVGRDRQFDLVATARENREP